VEGLFTGALLWKLGSPSGPARIFRAEPTYAPQILIQGFPTNTQFGAKAESVARTEGKIERLPVVSVGVARPPEYPDEKSFPNVANGRASCTMVPFLRSKKKFRLRVAPHKANHACGESFSSS